MTISDNINRIQKAKSDIKEVIEKNGISVGNITIDGYANKINQIAKTSKIFTDNVSVGRLELNGWTYPMGMKSLENMFGGCYATYLDVSDWDTSNVENLKGVFSGTLYLDELKGLETWDVSNVTDMSMMLSSTFMRSRQDVLDLSTWNTSNVQNMELLFSYNTMLRDVNISGWDMSNVQSAGGLFNHCFQLTSLQFGTGLKTSTSFVDCNNLTVESLLTIINGIADVKNTGVNPILTLGATNLAKLSDEQKAIATAKGWTLA